MPAGIRAFRFFAKMWDLEPSGMEIGEEIAPLHSRVKTISAYRSCFAVGGVAVHLNADRCADVALIPSLEPFRTETGVPHDVPQIEILVERVSNLFPAPGEILFDSGTTWQLHSGDSEKELHFDFNAAIFGDRPFKRLRIDSSFQRATLEMNRECLDDFPGPVEPLGYPLDELLIMHRLTQERAIELHGSGIVRANGMGNLFVGHSGAGKSTTTRLWTSREEVEVLSDDRIIVRPDAISSDDSACAETMPRLCEGFASRSHHSAQDDKTNLERRAQDDNATKGACNRGTSSSGMRMYGTPWHGEAMFASPNSAPLTRIFVLEHGDGNEITRLSKSQAVAELFARSFVPFHRHEYIDSALSFLEQIADSVPCYRYAFEPDQRAVDRILQFHD